MATKSYAISAYTYRSNLLCGECVVNMLVGEGRAQPGVQQPPEEFLSELAETEDVDRADEGSFDSGDFPKVVFRDQLHGDEECDGCGRDL